MQVQFTDHARERLSERGIAKRDVREALRHGRKTLQPDGFLRVVYGTSRLTVVCRPSGKDNYFVITAYYDGD